MNGDSDDTVYTVAFGKEGFLMVYNPKRKGWEMPGGHVRIGESREDGARREFLEEAGYRVELVEMRDLGYCRAFAAVIADEEQGPCEMDVRFFTEIPEDIAFSREEYEDVIPWAEAAVSEFSRARGI